jgi:hypothetical protein
MPVLSRAPAAVTRDHAPRKRQLEFRLTLLTVAVRVTHDGRLKSLARILCVEPETLAVWIRRGELTADRARQILSLPDLNPDGAPRITLADLAPSIAEMI